MKTLREYVTEKFKINKDLNVGDDRITDIDELKKIDINPIKDFCEWNMKAGELYKHYQKMEGYKNKGSKPERLVKSIKDERKLIIRWRMTIEMKWEEAYVVFRDAIIDRGYFNINELNAYLITYNKYQGNDYTDWITL